MTLGAEFLTVRGNSDVVVDSFRYSLRIAQFGILHLYDINLNNVQNFNSLDILHLHCITCFIAFCFTLSSALSYNV